MTKPTCRTTNCDRTPQPRARGYCKDCAYTHNIFQPFLPAEKARAIVRELHDKGYTHKHIAETAGLSETAISNISRAKYPSVRGHVYEALRYARTALNNATPIAAVQPGHEHRPGWPAARRLRALAAIGIPTQDIIDATGICKSSISVIRSEKQLRLPTKWDDAIRAYYETHQFDPARTPHHSVAKKNWPKPFDWDDIDDPNEDPAKNVLPVRPGYVELDYEISEIATYIITHHGTVRAAGRACGLAGMTILNISKNACETILERTVTTLTDHYHQIRGNKLRLTG